MKMLHIYLVCFKHNSLPLHPIILKSSIENQGARQLMGDEGLCLPNCQTNLVIALHALTVSNVLAFHKQQLTTLADMNHHFLLIKSSTILRTLNNRRNSLHYLISPPPTLLCFYDNDCNILFIKVKKPNH